MHEHEPKDADVARDRSVNEERARTRRRPTQARPGSRETTLDTTRAGALLLRVSVDRALAGLDSTVAGPRRTANLVAAARDVSSALHEVRALHEIRPIEWVELRSELAWSAGAIDRLIVELKQQKLDEPYAELGAAWGTFERALPESMAPSPLSIALAVPSPHVTAPEKIELASQMIAAARSQIKRLGMRGPDRGRDHAIAICAPLGTHIDAASRAVLAVPLHGDRARLKPDVEEISIDLDRVSEFLTATPKLDWDASFSHAFDAEATLRAALGMPRRARAYGGPVSPEAAAHVAKQVASGTLDEDYSTKRFENSADAVKGINTLFTSISLNRMSAIDTLEDTLKEPPRVEDPSIAQVLLRIALDAALSFATAGIGTLAAHGVNRAIAAYTIRRELGPGVVKHLTSAEQRDVAASLQSRGRGTNALLSSVLGDAAKDGAKSAGRGLVREALTASALTGLDQEPTKARNPLSAFIDLQRTALLEDAQNGGLAMAHVDSALIQLDLDALNVLKDELLAIAAAAKDIQYDASMREWQNFKARLGTTDGRESHRDTTASARDPAFGRTHVAGALSIRALHGAQPGAGLDVSSIELLGAEPAATRHYREKNQPLSTLGLHQQCTIAFPQLRETLAFTITPSYASDPGDGRAPEPVLQRESLDETSIALLKLLVARARVDNASLVMYLRSRDFDHVSDASAFRMADRLAWKLGLVRSGRLEAA